MGFLSLYICGLEGVDANIGGLEGGMKGGLRGWRVEMVL